MVKEGVEDQQVETIKKSLELIKEWALDMKKEAVETKNKYVPLNLQNKKVYQKN